MNKKHAYALLAMWASVSCSNAQQRLLFPLDHYAPREEYSIENELISISSKYGKANTAGCREAFGPLKGEDMRALLLHRQATFERNLSTKRYQYTWYINQESDQSFLCGEGKVYCLPLYVCRAGRPHLLLGADRLLALGERIHEMDVGLGVVFRLKSCDQAIAKFREVEVLLKTPNLVGQMANRNFATTIVSSAIHFADKICYNDGYTYTYPGIRADLTGGLKNHDRYRNTVVSVLDGTKRREGGVLPILRIRTQTSTQPNTIRISEFDGWNNTPRLTDFVLADISSFTAAPTVASPSLIAGDIVWGVSNNGSAMPMTDLTTTAQSTDDGVSSLTTKENATAIQMAVAQAYWHYAVMSCLVYRDGNLIEEPENWTPVESYTDKIGSGFYAEVWEKTELGGVVEVAVVFRGTNSLSLDSDGISDWAMGNLGVAQQNFAKQLANTAKMKYPNIRITFVGHSLGGALAKTAASHIEAQAVVFNSSPRGREPSRLVNIVEIGDVLSLPRGVLNASSTNVTAYNFTIGGPLENHRMYELARGLKDLAN